MIGEVFSAVSSGDSNRLKEILSREPKLANTENEEGLTPLGYAAHYGNAAAVKVLLEYGAEVNAISHSKIDFIPSNTALHAAISGERDMEVIKELLMNKANPNIFDSNGHTSLHTAAFHDDNVELITLLLEHGADLYAQVEDGIDAVSLAKERGNLRVAELLENRLEN